jgi:hypothetical protein
MKKIILFKDKLNLEAFLFFKNPDDKKLYLLEEFLIDFLDNFDQESQSKYRNFSRKNFNFCFHKMLKILYDLGFHDHLDLFYSQKSFINETFDDFWLVFYNNSDQKDQIIQKFFKELNLKFANCESDDEFFKILEKVFIELLKEFSEKKIIYEKYFLKYLIKIYKKIYNL